MLTHPAGIPRGAEKDNRNEIGAMTVKRFEMLCGMRHVRVVTFSSFSELITTQLRDFHMVSLQVVFTLLIFLTVQSYKVYLK